MEQEYDDSETTEVSLQSCYVPREGGTSIKIGDLSPQVLVDEVVEPLESNGSCTSTIRYVFSELELIFWLLFPQLA